MNEYKPKLDSAFLLPNGQSVNMYFDHPNNHGLDSESHILAARWHINKANSLLLEKNLPGAVFHQAQAILHSHAAHGVSTKEINVTSAPHDAELDRRAKEHNRLMDDLRPYRLSSYLQNKSIDKEKMIKFLNRIKQNNKMQKLENIQKSEQLVSEEDLKLIREIIARRNRS